ncbi:relaxase/mobilization nuclease domain-containing protein [Actinomyces bovis]|nr:relaxase/mobilization nuclease domain-containing protein [Actinomyces bovis]
MTETGVRSVGAARVYNRRTGKTELVKNAANHVWHCSLSLPAEEGALSDEMWRDVVGDFMDSMGFTGADGKAPCRWVALRHGTSVNGGDHVHIAVNVVREDGTRWSRWRDERNSGKAANAIEHKYGLRVIEAREHQRGARADSYGDLVAAKRAARDEEVVTDRARLETRVRSAAVSARSESDFVYRLSELGVRARPRFAAGRTDVVVGYSVALHSYDHTKRAQWYGAGRLARDLALPRLRARWADTPQDASRAARAWRQVWQGAKVVSPSAHVTSDQWEARAVGLRAFRDVLCQIDAGDPVALADATRDISGLLATAAFQRSDVQERSILEHASRAVGRHCQTHTRPAPKANVPSALALAAQTLSLALTNQSADSMLLVVEMMALVRSLAALYEQQAQTESARVMLRDTAQAFALVHAHEVALPASRMDQPRSVELVGQGAELSANRSQRLQRIGALAQGEPPLAASQASAAKTLPGPGGRQRVGPSDVALEAAGMSRAHAERVARLASLTQGGRPQVPKPDEVQRPAEAVGAPPLRVRPRTNGL